MDDRHYLLKVYICFSVIAEFLNLSPFGIWAQIILYVFRLGKRVYIMSHLPLSLSSTC